MKIDVIAVGSITRDIFLRTDRGLFWKTPENLLAPVWLGFELGEKIVVEKLSEITGGVAYDIAAALKKFQINTAPYSKIGGDELGKNALEDLKKLKISHEYVEIDKKSATSRSIILVDVKSSERVIFTEKSSGVYDLSRLPDIKCRGIFVASIKGSFQSQNSDILKAKHKQKSDLFLAPSTSQLQNDFPGLERLIREVKIIFLNRNEALEVAKKKKITHASNPLLIGMLRTMGAQTVCLTDGKKGAWVNNGEKIIHMRAPRVQAVDATGAGDAFASGFLGLYLKNYPIEICLKAGILNSASVVKEMGTTAGLMTKRDILEKI